MTAKTDRRKPRRLFRPRTAPQRPLVTVLVCNHNYERYVAAAIDSVLAQTYRPVEVLVIDDGSTDGSRRLLAGYRDRVRIILKANGGQASAVNLGFRESRGEYICFLDADDLFRPDKVARVVEVFERNPDVGWVYHELDYVDSDGKPLPLASLPDPANVRAVMTRRARYRETSFLDLRSYYAAGHRSPYTCPAFSALSFRRTTLAAILPMPEDIARASDEFPKIAAVALFPGVHVAVSLAEQRIHPANAATARTDAAVDQSLRYVKTAYHLRRRFAQIGPTADKWFASSFGRVIGLAGARTAFAAEESRRYLRDYFGPATWLRQVPRIALHATRESLRRVRRDGQLDRR
ncbi:MAG TPA: glycosyltransferase family A protein [Alphaproteobacteria bacterium]